MTSPEQTRRRWFQFRLRTLLIVVSLFSFPFAWVSWEVAQRRNESQTIDWIREARGHVEVRPSPEHGEWLKSTDDLLGPTARAVTLTDAEVTDLSPLTNLKSLEELSLNASYGFVVDLVPLSNVGSLRKLVVNMDSQEVDYSPLAQLTNLEELAIENMYQRYGWPPAVDLSFVTGLENLTRLTLNYAEVEDIAPLRNLKKLELLQIAHAQTSDLSPLAELENLEYLHLGHMQATDL